MSSSKYKVVDVNDLTLTDHREQRQLISYKKLVVPTRMRSIYWKYFGFPAGDDGRIVTKAKIVCILCKTQMTYNQNTSNLRMHLISKHRSAIQKIEPNLDIQAVIESSRGRKYKMKDPSKKTSVVEKHEEMLVVTKAGDVLESDISNIAIVLPNGEVNASDYTDVRDVDDSYAQLEYVEITEAIINFVITDLVHPDIVEGKGFLNLLSSISGKKLEGLSEQKLVTDNIATAYNACKEQLFNTISSNCITNISLSIEEWSCVDNVDCVSVYMHYFQNGEPRLFTKLLSTLFCTNHESSAYWDETLAKLISDWNINSNAITAVLVSISNGALKNSLKRSGFVVLSCFLSVVQQLCATHCFVHPTVAEILVKCRRLVKFIQEMKIDIEEDSHQELEEDENDSRLLCFDVPDLWLTSYYMLRNLYVRKNNIAQFIGDLETGPEDVVFSHHEWRNLSDLLNLLDPLKNVVVTLLEEKNAVISLLKPLIWQLNSSKYETAEKDSTMVRELKNTIKVVLSEAYAEEHADNLTQIAMTLDPRFKSFIQQDESHATLTDLLSNLVESEGSSLPEDVIPSPEKSLTKKTGRSSINALFGDFHMNKPVLSLEDKVKVEVTHYQNQAATPLEECPLEWWQLMRNKCPNLYRLASKYHCAPAIITWYSGCRTYKDYCTFYRKRSQLKTNVVDSLLFLSSNKCTQ